MAQVILIYTETDLPSGFEQYHKLIDALRTLGVPTEGNVVQVGDRKTETAMLKDAAANTLPSTTRKPRQAQAQAKAGGGNGAAAQDKQAARPAVSEDNDPDAEFDPDMDMDPGIADGTLTGAEAKDKAMTLVRLLNEHGFKKEWQAMRAKLNVATFTSLPETRGHEFYKLAVAAAEKAGLRV